MKQLQRGFTIVEIVIVITIMGILLTLAVVNLTSSQTSARDTERKNDVTAFATNLEAYYRLGASGSGNTGRYPSTGITSNATTRKTALPDLDPKAIAAPNVNPPSHSLVAATNATQTTTGVSPQPTTSQYVYQPLQVSGSSWSLCTSGSAECRKFNIYYRLEANNTVYMITSRNQ